jgi:hypothetical protein
MTNLKGNGTAVAMEFNSFTGLKKIFTRPFGKGGVL